MLWYDRSLENRVAGQWGFFEEEVRKTGHGWSSLDAGPLFAGWIAENPYRETLLAEPEELQTVLPEFEARVSDWLGSALDAAGEADLVSVKRCGALFGLARLSKILGTVEGRIKGRLMLTFPGRYTGSEYRMLDARPGWNYHAVPIPSEPA